MEEERLRQTIEGFLSIKEEWEEYGILMENGTYLQMTRKIGD